MAGINPAKYERRWLRSKYYTLLVERVSEKVKAGKSLDDIQKEVKMPEYASWASQDRMPTNIEAAYRMVTAKK